VIFFILGNANALYTGTLADVLNLVNDSIPLGGLIADLVVAIAPALIVIALVMFVAGIFTAVLALLKQRIKM